jgi:SMI1 / KNR4 family (SUKH-1)
MAANEIVTAFVDAAIQSLRRKDLMRLPLPDMPEEMRDTSIKPQDDWIGWKPIPSTVSDDELDALEREIGLAYPPSYRSFLKTSHFYELTEVGVRFARHPIRKWKAELRQEYQGWMPDRILGRGLIPFGSETFMDAGPVCFDATRPLSDGECPVVFWDHDSIDSDREIQPMFSSSSRMFQCLSLVATSGTNFVYHDPDDETASLPRKLELMQRFLSLDAEGAGGNARQYWTSWGVNPG